MIWLYVLLVICVFGLLWLINEVNNAPEIDDLNEIAHPTKEDL